MNRILASAIEAPAIVVKPSTPAISATTRKVRAQPNMAFYSFRSLRTRPAVFAAIGFCKRQTPRPALRSVFGALVLLTLGVPQPSFAQTAGAVVAAVSAETGDYQAAMAITDPAAQGAALESFIAQYPSSPIRSKALEKAAAAYLEARDLDRVETLSARLLALEPENARALAMLVFVQRARAASAPADQATVLADKAAANAERGLAAVNHWRPEDDAAPTDAEAVRAEMAAIFNGALGYRALARKDYASARGYYQAAVVADPSGLDDVYQLAVAMLQAEPLDPLGFWWGARAEDLAITAQDHQAQAAIEGSVRPRYIRYHGADDWDALLSQAQTGINPPADFAVTPAPSAASVAVQAVHDSPVSELSFSDWEFILAQRDASPENHAAADKVWDNIATLQARGLKMRFHAKVIAVTARELDVAIGDDNQQAGRADLRIDLDAEGASGLKPGSTVSVMGVLTGYTPSPFAFTMQQAEIAAD